MLATMFLKEQPVQRQLIPIEAIVREGNSEFVFVEQAAGVFRLEQVELGEEFEGMRVMLKPLPAGRRIVLEGAFHLNNERRKLLVQASEGE
jgi:cobalt-zinc-cadmium efflux system membrane fusion protein